MRERKIELEKARRTDTALEACGIFQFCYQDLYWKTVAIAVITRSTLCFPAIPAK